MLKLMDNTLSLEDMSHMSIASTLVFHKLISFWTDLAEWISSQNHNHLHEAVASIKVKTAKLLHIKADKSWFQSEKTKEMD